MHDASFQMLKYFTARYAMPWFRKEQRRLTVADVGAYDVNGTFRDLFAPECFTYTGLDVQTGPNVDRVVEHYNFGQELFDIVISGNTVEHVEDMYRWKEEFVRICKPGGLVCITAPHSFPEHKYPIDCWRIFPDGMKWLFRDLELLDCRLGVTDTLFIGRKRS